MVWATETSSAENENGSRLKEKTSLRIGIFGLMILPIAVVISMIITCWPQHNIILYPEYWYEPLGPIIFGLLAMQSATIMVQCQHILNVDMVLSSRVSQILKGFVISLSVGMVTWGTSYSVWVYLLGYNFPMPFVGHLFYLFQIFTSCISVWFLYPSRMRLNDMRFRKRLLICVGWIILEGIMGLGYSMIPSLLHIIPLNIQWCIGVFLTLVKKFNLWWSTKIGTKATGGDKESARLIMLINLGCTHACSLLILLGSTRLAPETAYIIMVMDSLVNAWSCISIMKLQRNHTSTIGQLE